MKQKGLAAILLVASAALLPLLSCAGKNTMADDGDAPLIDSTIEKKYLTEGFISTDLFRVVIVAPRDAAASELSAIRNRAQNRARASLERSLTEENIRIDANMKAEILNLIRENGQLARNDIGHSRYHVYYFNISKKNIKNYLKSVQSRE
jgi:hypothetical protein